MREYILTERERQLIAKTLRGERPDTYRQLKGIIIRSRPRLREDLELIDKFLKTVD